jgi:glycosyltransferase involved in cell wall biosynthesis
LKPVFHVITTIERGGAENQLLVLVREQIKLGLEVHVIYLKGEPELEIEFTQVGAKVSHVLALKNLIFQPCALGKLIRKSNPIVHAHLPRAELISFFAPAKFSLVVSRHNTEAFLPGSPKFISNFLSRIVELRSTKIIAISKAVRDYLINQGEVLNSQKIEVVLYGYKPIHDQKARNFDPSNNLLKFGTISRLTKQKDIPTLLSTFQIIQKDIPDATLSIVGSGSLDASLKELCNKLGLDSSVQFLGRTSMVMEYLEGLDVFILTSTYEGFGMVLLEAMDAGIPIVASRNSAIPEVLGADFPGLCETGNYREFSSKILELMDPEFRLQVLRLQEARLALFDAKSMAKKVSIIYAI